MEISFRTRKLEQTCSKKAVMERRLGRECAAKLQQRMMELQAALSLADISHLPPARLHALTGDKKGLFSVDLRHPFRLLFLVADSPVPLLEDGGIDKTRVFSVEIADLCDTHG